MSPETGLGPGPRVCAAPARWAERPPFRLWRTGFLRRLN